MLKQGRVVSALLRTAAIASRTNPDAPIHTPGPEYSETVPARSSKLIADYVRHVGGSPSAYRRSVPAHLFPQWGFPVMSKTLAGLPYDLKAVLNGGCRMQINAPIPAGEKLHLTARLVEVDDNDRRAVLKQRLVTSTDSAPEAMVADIYIIVPHRRGGKKGPKKAPVTVPLDAREVARWKLKPTAGRDFAILTGDINPVHWIGPYARMAGFKACILHGYSTLARAIESMNKNLWSGDISRLQTIDVRFTKPLVLPAEVGVYVTSDGNLTVGGAPGGAAFLTGEFTTRTP